MGGDWPGNRGKKYVPMDSKVLARRIRKTVMDIEESSAFAMFLPPKRRLNPQLIDGSGAVWMYHEGSPVVPLLRTSTGISIWPLVFRGVDALCHHSEYLLNFRQDLALLLRDVAKSVRQLLRAAAYSVARFEHLLGLAP